LIALFMLCSKSTNVSSDPFDHSLLRISSRVITSPARSSNIAKIANGWPRKRTRTPCFSVRVLAGSLRTRRIVRLTVGASAKLPPGGFIILRWDTSSGVVLVKVYQELARLSRSHSACIAAFPSPSTFLRKCVPQSNRSRRMKKFRRKSKEKSYEAANHIRVSPLDQNAFHAWRSPQA